MADVNLTKAAEQARLADAAYDEVEDLQDTDLGERYDIKSLYDFNENTVYRFTDKQSGHVAIAVRGTNSKEDVYQWDDIARGELTELGAIVAQEVKSHYESTGIQVTVTGHSLGGHASEVAARLNPNAVKEAWNIQGPSIVDSGDLRFDGLGVRTIRQVDPAVSFFADDYAAQLSDPNYVPPSNIYRITSSNPNFFDSLGIGQKVLNLAGAQIFPPHEISIPVGIHDSAAVVEYFFELGFYRKECFLAGTSIQMWPFGLTIEPRPDGTYNEALILSKGWKKTIEEIDGDDWVVSHDAAGKLQPGRVVRTMQNSVAHILDFWGTGVTPGHSYLCCEGEFQDQHVPLMDILRTDGAIMRVDGTMIRATTGCEVGSEGDRKVVVVTGELQPNGLTKLRETKELRLGTRFFTDTGSDLSLQEVIDFNGGAVREDGYIVVEGSDQKLPFEWTFTPQLPRFEDYILQRSGLTLSEIYRENEWEIQPRMLAPDESTHKATASASIFN